MFESICIRRQNVFNPKQPLNLGLLAECLLFYGKVNIIADHFILEQLLTEIGIETVLELLSEDLVNIIYVETFTGILTDNIKIGQIHRPEIFTISKFSKQDVIRKIVAQIVGKSGKSRRISIKLENYIKNQQHPSSIIEETKKDYKNTYYVNESIKILINKLVPEHKQKDDYKCTISEVNNGIIFNSNLNFIELNNIYHKRIPMSHSSITPAYLLSFISDVQNDLYFSSNLLSELASNEINSSLLGTKISYIISKRSKSDEEIKGFENLIFNNAKTIKESINNGELNFSDFVKILKKAGKFKNWLVNQTPRESLINEYFKAVTKETFIDKLPTKYIRWTIFTGIGLSIDQLYGTVAGIALSAFDSFLIDKLVGGWKPNQFIDEELKKAINK